MFSHIYFRCPSDELLRPTGVKSWFQFIFLSLQTDMQLIKNFFAQNILNNLKIYCTPTHPSKLKYNSPTNIGCLGGRKNIHQEIHVKYKIIYVIKLDLKLESNLNFIFKVKKSELPM